MQSRDHSTSLYSSSLSSSSNVAAPTFHSDLEYDRRLGYPAKRQNIPLSFNAQSPAANQNTLDPSSLIDVTRTQKSSGIAHKTSKRKGCANKEGRPLRWNPAEILAPMSPGAKDEEASDRFQMSKHHEATHWNRCGSRAPRASEAPKDRSNRDPLSKGGRPQPQKPRGQIENENTALSRLVQDGSSGMLVERVAWPCGHGRQNQPCWIRQARGVNRN